MPRVFYSEDLHVGSVTFRPTYIIGNFTKRPSWEQITVCLFITLGQVRLRHKTLGSLAEVKPGGLV